MFAFLPLYKGAFAPGASYRDLSFRMAVQMYRIAWRTLTDKKYRSLFPVALTAPPRMYTDMGKVRVKESWQGEPDNCDICDAHCCIGLKCPLLDKNGRCLSYGSLYFGYFNCGRFPETQAQIDYYDCPKWEGREKEDTPEK